jgi:hypothetical protein
MKELILFLVEIVGVVLGGVTLVAIGAAWGIYVFALLEDWLEL